MLVFVPGKPFQYSLMFSDKIGAYPKGSAFEGATLKGRLQALPANIRVAWKGLPGTNTLG